MFCIKVNTVVKGYAEQKYGKSRWIKCKIPKVVCFGYWYLHTSIYERMWMKQKEQGWSYRFYLPPWEKGKSYVSMHLSTFYIKHNETIPYDKPIKAPIQKVINKFSLSRHQLNRHNKLNDDENTNKNVLNLRKNDLSRDDTDKL